MHTALDTPCARGQIAKPARTLGITQAVLEQSEHLDRPMYLVPAAAEGATEISITD